VFSRGSRANMTAGLIIIVYICDKTQYSKTHLKNPKNFFAGGHCMTM
jgi:hypothetical protein